eukprot:s2360_g1.t1
MNDYDGSSFCLHENDIFNYGTLPSGVLEILRSNWTMECTIYNENYIGFSLLGSEPHAVDCPTHLRYQEVERVMPRMMPVEESFDLTGGYDEF